MSTADEIMLRAEFARPAVAEIIRRWEAEVAGPLARCWWAQVMWRMHLQLAADATRYQLTWNGQWAGRSLDSWTLKQWARAVDLLYRGDTPLPPATYAGALRAWSDWRSQMNDEPPGATAIVVGTWRWDLRGQLTESPATLSPQPSVRAQEWAWAVRDAVDERRKRLTYQPTKEPQ